MRLMAKWLVVAVVGAGVASTACSAATVADDEAPAVSDTPIDPKDEGNSYDGWTQEPMAAYDGCSGTYSISHWLTRGWGDATRAGGACWTYPSSSSCSSDTTCTAEARSVYGSSAFGYCYAGSCYARPGAPSTYCVTGSNRDPGVLQRFDIPGPGINGYAVGCMSKAAGPNSACGGTNSSLYMRYVTTPYYYPYC